MQVSTQLTTWGELAPAVTQESSTFQRRPTAESSASESSGIMLEGWQKKWEQPPASAQALGIAPPNIRWLKCGERYGLFDGSSKYKNAKGELVERKLFKEKMEFHLPPPPVSVKGSVPHMMAFFFTTPAFFWRPVGVMKAKILLPQHQLPCTARGIPGEEMLWQLWWASV